MAEVDRTKSKLAISWDFTVVMGAENLKPPLGRYLIHLFY